MDVDDQVKLLAETVKDVEGYLSDKEAYLLAIAALAPTTSGEIV